MVGQELKKSEPTLPYIVDHTRKVSERLAGLRAKAVELRCGLLCLEPTLSSELKENGKNHMTLIDSNLDGFEEMISNINDELNEIRAYLLG